jgi:hypothetical protein
MKRPDLPQIHLKQGMLIFYTYHAFGGHIKLFTRMFPGKAIFRSEDKSVYEEINDRNYRLNDYELGRLNFSINLAVPCGLPQDSDSLMWVIPVGETYKFAYVYFNAHNRYYIKVSEPLL